MERGQARVLGVEMFVHIAQQLVDDADRQPAADEDGVGIDDQADMLDRDGQMRAHFLQPLRNQAPAMRIERQQIVRNTHLDVVAGKKIIK